MKFLVIGGSGLIGWKLVQLFIQEGNDVEFTFLTNKTQLLVRSHQIDITQNNVTAELLKKINPDIVFHTAALTNVDLCETNKQMADTINVNGTKNIIEGCKVTKSKLVFLSTCFVFDGKKQQYFEEDKPSPSTYYGLTKFKGEELVKNSGLDYLILRTDQPYCWIQKW